MAVSSFVLLTTQSWRCGLIHVGFPNSRDLGERRKEKGKRGLGVKVSADV